MERRKTTIKLNEELECFFIVKKDGQRDPSESDEVRVELSMCLPGGEEHNYQTIERGLKFKDRCQILGEWLFQSWGTRDIENKSRVCHKWFYGEKWASTFDEAENYALCEIAKLKEMLKQRHQALLDAE